MLVRNSFCLKNVYNSNVRAVASRMFSDTMNKESNSIITKSSKVTVIGGGK
jgi:hypothetical protein